jgi:hypothetical protein
MILVSNLSGCLPRGPDIPSRRERNGRSRAVPVRRSRCLLELTGCFWVHYTGPVRAPAILPAWAENPGYAVRRTRIHFNTYVFRAMRALTSSRTILRGCMRTRFRSVSLGSLAGALGLSLVVAGCGQYSFSALAAKKSVMEAHEAYKGSRWLEAAEKYEAAVNGDPTLRGAHFFLANSYDNLYKPSRAGEPENDRYMQKAIEW